jgi:DNA-binding NarL/FixJ family response regulator
MPPRVRIVCQAPEMRRHLETHFQRNGFDLCATADITILVDQPLGSALTHLEREGAHPNLLVTTENQCSAYWQAILEFTPRGFLVGRSDPRDLELAVQVLARDGRMHRYPPLELNLPKRERRVLRLVASGLENKRIAKALGLSDRVVARYLDDVFGKVRAAHPELNIENRTQLALWFWGIWDV